MRPGNRLNNPENNNLNTTLSNQFDIMAATTITTTPSMATMATISGKKGGRKELKRVKRRGGEKKGKGRG
jgi:hypothetical protein